MSNNKDLTSGKPLNVLVKFCIPLFLSVIFQQLYNIADSVVAGNMIGQDALSAISNSYEITLIFIAFAFGCNIGCSVIVADFFGAKDYKNVKSAITTSFIASLVTCLILMLLGLVLTNPLLKMIKTPDSVYADSKAYLDIYIYSLPFVFVYNIATGIFAALGDSKTPFIFLAVSSVINVFVDILFVGPFKMGVAGTAYATLLCQGVSAVLAFIVVFLRIKNLCKDSEKSKIFDMQIFKNFSIVAIPSILQQSFISVGNIFIQSVVNSFGTEVMAGYGASVKLNNMVITAFTTLGNGVSNYAAQNIGAGKKERIKPGFFSGALLVWIICLPIVILYLAIPDVLTSLFINNPTEQALNTGAHFLRTVSPFYFVVSLKLVADGILRGSRMMGKFMIATFTDLILRVLLAFMFAKLIGETGIWWSWPLGWTVSSIISIVFTYLKYGRVKKIELATSNI